MIQTGLIPNAHSDLITDASYDFYGLRLATCSLDQRIKIWRLDETSGAWNVEDDWKAHDASISKVSWAHPEFGTVLASGSFDRTVKVWEQANPGDGDAPQLNGAGPSSASRWVERAMLVDAKGTVRSVEFAPHHFGLKLATISSDNFLRVYECLEQPSLATWQLSDEVDVTALPSASAPRSIAPTVTLTTPTQPSATLDAASVSLAAHAVQQQQQQSQLPSRPGLGYREADGGWCISWCKDRYWGEIIAASSGINGLVKIIQLSARPSTILTLDPTPAPRPLGDGAARGTASPADGDAPQPYAITTISWAPSCGRSYHLVATGGRDGHVRIWRVKPPALEDGGDTDGTEGSDARWSAAVVADFDDHKSSVGRVEWNVTGTVLSSSGNDGRVRLWKMTAGNVWRPAGHISVEQAEEQAADVDMDEAPVQD
ncbi:WD40 repeat-like protein [Fomitopsis serialis]|uniref:WD40 repeat-like protein n=1 Tax=Fomitopsis serialis TaxID=139415 RepID=UPI002008BA86|nr:WD40 repeat-like protein [Neoantrodia serialis]KAH9926762.1 WD40 repeat-like protein [Neoantrodia serialis]